MEVLELKPIKNKEITVYLIDKIRISLQHNDIDVLKELVETNEISFITVETSNENFKEFKNSNLSIILNGLNLEFHLLDIPEYAYGYLFDEINKKENQIKVLSSEYRNLNDKNSFKALNLNSWIEVLKKEVIHDKTVLDTKTRPQWIVKKILDIARLHKNEKMSLIHFFQEGTLAEITKQFRELHIEVIVYELNNFHNFPYIIIKQEEIN